MNEATEGCEQLKEVHLAGRRKIMCVAYSNLAHSSV